MIYLIDGLDFSRVEGLYGHPRFFGLLRFILCTHFALTSVIIELIYDPGLVVEAFLKEAVLILLECRAAKMRREISAVTIRKPTNVCRNAR